MSKKPGAAVAAVVLATNIKGKLPAGSKEARVRDECVNAILDSLYQGIDLYIADKAIFPKIIAHAVSRTVGEMVHMVSVAHVQRMETWLVSLEGGAPEEWDKPSEPLIPLVDSWARGVIPIKKATDASPSATPIEPSPRDIAKQPRQASFMALAPYQDQPIRRRSSDKGMRGSLRRFSDTPLPFDPSRKVKFGDPSAEAPKESPGSRRASVSQTVTPEDLKASPKTSPKDEKASKASPKGNAAESNGGGSGAGSRRTSLTKDGKSKTAPSVKKKT